MRKAVVLLCALLFTIWILPLGVYIKPAQEKLACAGQRAICLCSHEQAVKAKSNTMEGWGRVNPSSHKETSPSGVGHYYVSAKHLFHPATTLMAFVGQEYLSYKNPYLASLEHVPKA